MMPPKPQQAPKAYSYLRFSTPEQQEGDSVRRQIAVTQAFAKELGLDLDESLRFEDRGVSAFRGKNSAEGALSEFLEYAKAGKVPAGSYLMVESLDRLSRDEVLDAIELLRSILKLGISLAVVNGRKVFSLRSVNANPMELMVALLSFSTAHEESAKKSYRTLENWKSKRAGAVHGEVISRRGLAWLAYNDTAKAWEPIPERVAIVERIFREYLAGRGTQAIAGSLNTEGVPTWGKTRKADTRGHWQQSYIQRILFSPVVIGTLELSTEEATEDGQKVTRKLDPVPNYYPAVIDTETWKQVQAFRKSGGQAPRKSAEGADLGNVFAHLLRCGKCGHSASAVNKHKGANGERTYVVCNRARAKAGCEWHSLSYVNLEECFRRSVGALIESCPSGEPSGTLDAEIERIDAALLAIPEQLERLTKLYAMTGTQAVADELMQVDAERETLEAQRAELVCKVSDISGPVVAKRLDALCEALAAEQEDRRHVNACLRLLFSAVEVDAENGIARFQWKHGGTSEIVVSMPVDRAEISRRNAAKGRAAIAAKGHAVVIANLVKARAARAAKLAAKREAAKAAEVVTVPEAVTTEAA